MDLGTKTLALIKTKVQRYRERPMARAILTVYTPRKQSSKHIEAGPRRGDCTPSAVTQCAVSPQPGKTGLRKSDHLGWRFGRAAPRSISLGLSECKMLLALNRTVGMKYPSQEMIKQYTKRKDEEG